MLSSIIVSSFEKRYEINNVRYDLIQGKVF